MTRFTAALKHSIKLPALSTLYVIASAIDRNKQRVIKQEGNHSANHARVTVLPHEFAKNNDLANFEELVKKYGTDIVNSQDQDRKTPLMHVSDTAMAGYLLSIGADTEIQDKYGKTARVIFKDKAEEVEEVIEKYRLNATNQYDTIAKLIKSREEDQQKSSTPASHPHATDTAKLDNDTDRTRS